MPLYAKEASLEKQVLALHALAGGKYCDPIAEAYDDEPVQSWTFKYEPGYGSDEEEVTLFRVWCMSGAYNENHAYYLYRDFEGLQPLSFAMPKVDVKYEDEDVLESPIKSTAVVGFVATGILTNSSFDPETLEITHYARWRGIGDASSSGLWKFEDGDWALKHYEMDASYDEEMNPEVVVDY